MIKDELTKGNISRALDLLTQFIEVNRSIEKEVRLLETNHNEYMTEDIKGKLGGEEKDIQRAKIVDAIFHVYDKLEEYNLDFFPTAPLQFGSEPLITRLRKKLEDRYQVIDYVSTGESAHFFRAAEKITENLSMLRVVDLGSEQILETKESVDSKKEVQQEEPTGVDKPSHEKAGRKEVQSEEESGRIEQATHKDNPEESKSKDPKKRVDDSAKKDDQKEEKSDKSENLIKITSLKHRNIIKILHADLSRAPQYIALEYIHGVSMDHLIGTVPFSTKRALSIFKQLCHAIHYLHINGMVHKNIKPDKIIIDEELVPMISVFDLASSGSPNTTLSINELLYAPPELFQNIKLDLDSKADQFSLAVLALGLFKNAHMFSDHTIEKQINALHIIENRLAFFHNERSRKILINKLTAPKEVKKVLFKMTTRDPSERYDHLGQVIEILERVEIKPQNDADIAAASYERSCIANRKLTEDFYEELFKKAKHHSAIKQVFDKVDKEHKRTDCDKDQAKTRRYKMLRIAIELLIHSQNEKQKFMDVLNIKKHPVIENHLHNSFIETIIKVILNNDPLVTQKIKTNEAGTEIKLEELQTETANSIKAAWENIRTHSQGLIKDKLPVQADHSP